MVTKTFSITIRGESKEEEKKKWAGVLMVIERVLIAIVAWQLKPFQLPLGGIKRRRKKWVGVFMLTKMVSVTIRLQ